MKKRTPAQVEIDFDPSLRWYSEYRQGEQLWSATHQAILRFWAYVGPDRAQLASRNGIAPLPGTVPLTTLKRPDTRLGS